MSISLRIKELRLLKKMNQMEFSKHLGVSQAAVSHYESGQRSPDSHFLSKVCEAFSTNINWLLTGEGDMYNVRACVEPFKKSTIPIDIIPDIAAGSGYDCTYSEPLYTLQMPAHLLHRPAPFYGFRVTGDSMTPDIVEGDLVILSGNWEGLSLDGLICGFRTADGMVLKRLVLDHHKKEGWLFSINQQYRPIRYTKHTPDLVLLGVLCALIRNYIPES